MIDVTTRMRDGRERSSSMALQAIEGMIDPVILLTASGFVDRVNRGYVENFGLDRAVPGTNLASLFLGMSVQEVRKLLKRCVDQGRIRNLEARITDYEGKVLPVLVNISPLRNSQQVLDGFVVAIRDISDLVGTTEQREGNERELDTILNASETAAIIRDTRGTIKSGNRALDDRCCLPLKSQPEQTYPDFDIPGNVKELAVFPPDMTERRMTEEALRTKNALLKNLIDGTIMALVKAVELRDPYTAGHQQRVALLAEALARKLDLHVERVEATRISALLHDVGKISVPLELMSKPGRLLELEIQLIRQHPVVTYDILRSIPFPYPIAQFALEHHEKYNGSGYPAGLRGNAISLESRIICVADVVDATASHRPYRPSRGLALALAEIEEGAGELYDPTVSAACLELFRKDSFAFAEVPVWQGFR